MPSSIIINGASTSIPGVYSTPIIDTSGQVLLGEKNLCVVGAFPQLEPANATDYKVSKNILLSSVIPSPSNDIQTLFALFKNALPRNSFGTTAKSLTFVNAQVSTQAKGFIKNSTVLGNIAANTNIIALKSKIWGTKGNNITLSIVKNADDKYVITGKPVGGDTQTVTMLKDFINPIELYVKAAAGVSIRIRDGVLAIATDVSTIADGVAPTVLHSFTLSDFATNNQLFEALMATGLFYAPGDTGFETHPSSVKSLLCTPSQLDCIMRAHASDESNFPAETAVDNKITLSAYTEGIIHAINTLGQASLPFEAEIVSANLRIPAANITDVSLPANGIPTQTISTYGTSPTVAIDGSAPDADDYAAALNATKSKNIQIITCFDNTVEVLLKLNTYLNECDSVAKYRNAWFGTAKDLSLNSIYSSYVLQAKSPYISIVGQGLKTSIGGFDEPKYLAFLLMCVQGELPAATPLTNKVLSAVGDLYQVWTRDDDAVVEDAISKNITVLRKGITQDFVVVRPLTTYRSDNLTVNTDVSGRESLSTCLLDLQNFLYSRIGEAIGTSELSLVESLAKERLSLQVSQSVIKAFRNVSAVVSNDTIFIEFELAVAQPLNFIKITAFVSDF